MADLSAVAALFADPTRARIVAALAVLAPQQPVPSLRESTRAGALRRARTCYDRPRAPQVFGALGVDVAESAALLAEMESAVWIRRQASGRAVQITDAGRSALRATLGVEL